jgi:hypothetical protein
LGCAETLNTPEGGRGPGFDLMFIDADKSPMTPITKANETSAAMAVID